MVVESKESPSTNKKRLTQMQQQTASEKFARRVHLGILYIQLTLINVYGEEIEVINYFEKDSSGFHSSTSGRLRLIYKKHLF